MFPPIVPLKDNPFKSLTGVPLPYRHRKTASRRRQARLLLSGLTSALAILTLAPAWLAAQNPATDNLDTQKLETDKPVPILTGSIGTFSFVTGGQNLIDTQINPILLVPLGDKWLIESRAEFEGQFQRPLDGGSYAGPVTKHVDYAQIDYIASPYVTSPRADSSRRSESLTSACIPSGFVFCSPIR